MAFDGGYFVRLRCSDDTEHQNVKRKDASPTFFNSKPHQKWNNPFTLTHKLLRAREEKKNVVSFVFYQANGCALFFFCSDPKKASNIYLSLVDVHQLSFMRNFNQLLLYCGSSTPCASYGLFSMLPKRWLFKWKIISK